MLVRSGGGGIGRVPPFAATHRRIFASRILRRSSSAFHRRRFSADVVSHDGDIKPTVHAAPVIAHRLLELGVSAVVDLYELKLSERRAFVRGFINALMAAPRSLWRPCLFLLDEAHRFCPERDSGQSEATDAVITLLSPGRKRGFGTVLATQRLSKLHKDAAAEAVNVLVGRTTLDVDVARARDILGLTRKDAGQLRTLRPGHWYSVRPAFNIDQVTMFRASQIQTTHPRAGERHLLSAPRPSTRLRKVIAELAALAENDDNQVFTLEDARAEIGRLQGQLRKQVKAASPGHTAIKTAVRKAEATLRAEFETERAARARLIDQAVRTLHGAQAVSAKTPSPPPQPQAKQRERPVARAPQQRQANGVATESADGLGHGGMGRMLMVLAQHAPQGCNRMQLGLLARMSPKSGTFATYLGKLRAQGWAEGTGQLVATNAGIEALGEYTPLPSGDALVSHWLDWCGRGGMRRMLQALIDAGDDGLRRTELAESAGLSPGSGTFATYLGKLRSAQLAEGRDRIVAAPTLLDAS